MNSLFVVWDVIIHIHLLFGEVENRGCGVWYCCCFTLLKQLLTMCKRILEVSAYACT